MTDNPFQPRDEKNPFSLLSRPPEYQETPQEKEQKRLDEMFTVKQPYNLAGRLVSAGQYGTTGAQVGGLLGGTIGSGAGAIPGAIIGGIGGGLYGFTHPTNRPLTDAGASIAEFLGNRLIPGAGSASRALRVGRGLAIGGLTAGGAAVGQMGDKAADFVLDTEDGPIAFYGGTSAAGLALSALMRPGTSVAGAAAERIKSATGIDVPLTFYERTGSMGGLESLVTQGTRLSQRLGGEQNKAITAAMEKVLGREKSEGKLLEIALGTQAAGKTEFKAVETVVKEHNAPILKQIQEIKKAAGESGQLSRAQAREIARLQKTLQDPTTEFKAKFGLSDEEFSGFAQAVRTNPEFIIDRLVPTGREPIKNLLMFRGLFKVLPEREKGILGEALVNRILQRNTVTVGGNPFYNGRKLLSAIENYGLERLNMAIGEDRVKVLKDIAMVMDETDPLNKVRQKSGGWGQAIVRYVTNKQVFAITGAFSGAGGATLGPAVGGALQGALVGGTVAVPTTLVISHLLANPKWADFLVRASRGDATAATRLIRALVSSSDSEFSGISEGGQKPTTLMRFLRVSP